MSERILALLPKAFFPGSVYFGKNSLMYLKTIDREKALALVSESVMKSHKEKLDQLLSGCRIKTLSGEPTKARAEELREEAREFETVLGIGGGSVMDLAKTAKLREEPVKLVLIPTTSGTGSEASRYSVLTNEKREKEAIVSERLLPDTVLLDPSFLVSLPRLETFYTSLDSISHSLEGLVSRMSNTFTDALALKSLDMTIPNLEKTLSEPENLIIRENLQVAGLLAGIVQSSASVGIIHSLAHYFGPKVPVPHGVAVGVFMIEGLKANMKNTDAYSKLDQSLFLKRDNLIETLQRLFREFGFEEHLKNIEFSTEDPDAASDAIMRDACTKTNPFMPTQEQVKEILGRLDVRNR